MIRDLGPILGLPENRYGAGSDGRIYSRRGLAGRCLPSWRPMAEQYKNGSGTVRLMNGRYWRHRFSVASLVCRAFHGPRPLGCEPFHYPDKDPTNCRADNLRWAPRGTRLLGDSGVAPPVPRRKLTDEQVAWARLSYQGGQTIDDLSDVLGIHRSSVHAMITGLTYRHVSGAIVGQKNAATGIYQNFSKLDEQVVQEIRVAHKKGVKITALARTYNVARSTIRAIVLRRTWRAVIDEDEDPAPNQLPQTGS